MHSYYPNSFRNGDPIKYLDLAQHQFSVALNGAPKFKKIHFLVNLYRIEAYSPQLTAQSDQQKILVDYLPTSIWFFSFGQRKNVILYLRLS